MNKHHRGFGRIMRLLVTGRLKSVIILMSVCLLLTPQALGQARDEVEFPDILGYETLVCDFHMHTVFSDGRVWPNVRVDEAWRQGYDVIAITDHIEYKPHEETVSAEMNVSYEIAEPAAKAADILFPMGAELTRETPPGHFNAVFLADIRPLDTEQLVDAIKAANEQGAFVFWNHPNWKGPERGQWQDFHETLYQNRWLHGVEVVNGDDYDPAVHKMALEKNLTMLGNSDIHSPSLIELSSAENHRVATLVFAKAKTLDAVKEALFAGRTTVWHEDLLIGKEEYLDAIFQAAVDAAPSHYRDEEAVWVKVKNRADINIDLKRTGTLGPREIELAADATTLLKIKPESAERELVLQYTADNLLITPDKGLPIEITIPLR